MNRFVKLGPDAASFAFAKLQEFPIIGPNESTESKFDVSISGHDFTKPLQ